MTNKEMLYAQDVKNHAKHFCELCKHCKEMITDPTLKSFIEAVTNECDQTISKVSNLGGMLK